MPRLLVESFDQLLERFQAMQLRQRLRDQLVKDKLLDHVVTRVGEGWLSREAAEARRRFAQANGAAQRVSADNQAALIRAYRKTKPAMQIYDDEQTAAAHGLRPEDLRNVSSGRKRKRAKKAKAEFAYRYRGE